MKDEKFIKEVSDARTSELIAWLIELNEQKTKLKDMITEINDELKRRKQDG